MDRGVANVRIAQANERSEKTAQSIAEKTGVDASVLKVRSADKLVDKVLKAEALAAFLDDLDSSLPEAETPQTVESLDEVGPDLAAKLEAEGIVTLADLAGASDETLLAVDGIGPATLSKIREQV